MNKNRFRKIILIAIAVIIAFAYLYNFTDILSEYIGSPEHVEIEVQAGGEFSSNQVLFQLNVYPERVYHGDPTPDRLSGLIINYVFFKENNVEDININLLSSSATNENNEGYTFQEDQKIIEKLEDGVYYTVITNTGPQWSCDTDIHLISVLFYEEGFSNVYFDDNLRIECH